MLTAPIQKLSPVTKKREGQRCHNTATVAITLLDACHEVVINHKTGRHLAEVQQGGFNNDLLLYSHSQGHLPCSYYFDMMLHFTGTMAPFQTVTEVEERVASLSLRDPELMA